MRVFFFVYIKEDSMAIINGQEINHADNMILMDYLQNSGYSIAKVAVEINGKIISKKQYDTTVINETDKIEIVTFVGGG